MRARSRRETGDVAPVNATPLIDVVLCMIVFFLLVGRLAQGQRTPMRLPESASGSADMPRDSFVINVSPGSGGAAIQINEESATLEAIGPALKKRLESHPTLTVQVRAPRDIPFGDVEPVIEACASVGVTDVRLATERSRESGGAR